MRDDTLNTKVGQQITIVKPIGRGRLGTVFAAVHSVLARRFAVKVLLPLLTQDENVQRRLRRMIREASTVQHPNVIGLLDFGQMEDGRFFLTMDYARGIQLTKALERDSQFPILRAVALLKQLAAALEAAHIQRVVHGDVKPNNIIIFEEHNGSEALRLYDFKLMQALAPSGESDDPLAHLRLHGSFDYVSPEQIDNARVDGRADIYAFGAVAYRMLAGEPPFFGTPEEVLNGHRSRDPVPPSRRAGAQDVPAELDDIILRCLQKSPEDRYRSMEEIGHDLEALCPKSLPERFEEQVTGRWELPPELEQEEKLPESPPRLRQMFYDTLIELADQVAAHSSASEELVYALAAVKRIKEQASSIASRSAVTENRFEDIRRELRERESTLRYAIIDLNLSKADLQEQAAPDPDALRDLEHQISGLERSLTQLEEQRAERFAVLNTQLSQYRETLKGMEQELAIHYRRLYASVDQSWMNVNTSEVRKLRRLLERCRSTLAESTALPRPPGAG